MKKLTIGSTFSGVGGIDLGFENTGKFETLWLSEVDPHASAVLAHRWPNVHNYGDIHAVRDVPRPDIVVGGFPCQDYSVSGLRNGLAGDRGALWWELHRVIDETRPLYFVGENVRGLLSSKRGGDFRTIVDSLLDIGYSVTYRLLDSRYFGVAQRRSRLVIVAYPDSVPRPEILSLTEGLQGHPEPSQEAGEGLSPGLGGSAGGGGESGRLRSSSGKDYVGSLTTAFGPKNYSNFQEVRAGSLVYSFAQNQRNEVRDLQGVAGALAARPGMKQQTYVVAPEPRRLTPVECERLQGFPDDWTGTGVYGDQTKVVSDTQRYKQLGNAVSVPVFEWVAERIWEDYQMRYA